MGNKREKSNENRLLLIESKKPNAALLRLRRNKIIIINSREAIAAIIGDIVVFYNSKNLNSIGALSFF